MKLKYYLIASEKNDYKPWIMTSKAMAFFTLLIWSVRIIVPANLTFAVEYLNPTDLMARINNERTSRHITALITNSKLITAAQEKSDDMLHRSYFAHVDPDGNYVWPKIEAAGYTPYVTLGENLAMDFTSPSELVDAWMNSPTHRANVLNEKFEDQGLALSSGLYEPNHNTTLVASLFGTLAKTSKPTPPPPAQTPKPTPPPAKTSSSTTTPNPTPTSTQPSLVTINNDAKVNITQISGHTLIDLDVTINGKPTLVTARLKTQSITLLAAQDNHYTGQFNFNATEQLNGESATIEARDNSGNKTTSNVDISGVQTSAVADASSANPNPTAGQIPISSEAQLMQILRIIFGVLSVIYLGFLVADAIIIHRAKIQRPGMHITPQIIIFVILASLNLFGKF